MESLTRLRPTPMTVWISWLALPMAKSPDIPTIRRMHMVMWLTWQIQQVQLPSPTPIMHSVWRRISMTLIRMRSGIVVNTKKQKRVRFICELDIMILQLVDLFQEIAMQEKMKIRWVWIGIRIVKITLWFLLTQAESIAL